jgi:hypothetical protein
MPKKSQFNEYRVMIILQVETCDEWTPMFWCRCMSHCCIHRGYACLVRFIVRTHHAFEEVVMKLVNLQTLHNGLVGLPENKRNVSQL